MCCVGLKMNPVAEWSNPNTLYMCVGIIIQSFKPPTESGGIRKERRCNMRI